MLKADEDGHPPTGTDTKYHITASGSVSGSLKGGTGDGPDLINECYWVVETLSPLTLESPAHSMASSICSHYRQEWIRGWKLASAPPSVGICASSNHFFQIIKWHIYVLNAATKLKCLFDKSLTLFKYSWLLTKTVLYLHHAKMLMITRLTCQCLWIFSSGNYSLSVIIDLNNGDTWEVNIK